MHQAIAAVDWINREIPFEEGSAIYRPELVARFGKGNCFAQALGGLLLLEEWQIPAGVVLNGPHALLVGLFDTEIVFLDPYQQSPSSCLDFATQNGNHSLYSLYESRLSIALAEQDFVLYFGQDSVDVHDNWSTFRAPSIREVTGISDMHCPQVIVDRGRGKRMLLATGDLARYERKQDHEKYAEAYANQADDVPAFIHLTEPDLLKKIIDARLPQSSR